MMSLTQIPVCEITYKICYTNAKCRITANHLLPTSHVINQTPIKKYCACIKGRISHLKTVLKK